jgi:four helix bundle protein
MNNIAEGYGRRSDRALGSFLNIARGSISEVESMVLLGFNLGYIDEAVRDELLSQIEDTVKLLTSFINKIHSDVKSLPANR